MSRPTPSATEPADLGERLARAITSRDRAGLRELFPTPVRFTAVTPRRFWDAETPVGVEDVFFGAWFPDSMSVTRVQMLQRAPVGTASTFGYRLWVDTTAGPTVIEQVGYYREQDGRMADVRLVCSGFHRV